MYKELTQKKSNYAIQKVFELDRQIDGYDKVIVSCKPNGANGLKGSFFIWGTKDGENPEKELDWDTEDCNFNHETVLENRIKRGKKTN